MANSLIPYSFVPGTKAMASEVNANFIALASAVEEGKEFTSESIQQFNEDMEERLEQALQNKLETNFSNSLNIANTVVEIPKNINLELNDGVLTLKAGSVVIVPDGFESDGITPKFEYLTIEQDVSVSSSGFAGSYDVGTVFYNVTTNSFGSIRNMPNEVFSSDSAPYLSTGHGYWYDSNSNVVRYYLNSSTKWTSDKYSLPICTITNNAESITAINRIFNGFGFIGSAFWVDKNVKILVPNGRDEKGNYINEEYVTDTFKLQMYDSTFTRYNATLCLGTEGFLVSTQTFYINSENYNRISGNISSNAIIATLDIVNGVVYNLKFRDVLKFVDIHDNVLDYATFCSLAPSTTTTAAINKPAVVINNYKSGSNWYRVWSDGWIEQGGRGGGEYSKTFLKPFRDTNYTILVVPLSSDGSNDNCMVKSISTTGFSAYVETNNSGFWYACGY